MEIIQRTQHIKNPIKNSDKKCKAIYQSGYAVIQAEANAIYTLLERMNDNFVEACEALLDCPGKIIVIGIGKSGHIGKKMAATFASTGSPAFFVHPSEAKHGDFGMITTQDVILMLSYSGETEEILAILPFIKRLNIPLISITGHPNSTLAAASLVHLDIHVDKEACPLGLAPTSSTTATLVMGDALAITLLEQRGFTAEDFAFSHPGGSLGKKLLRVESIMHKNDALPKVTHDASLKTALYEMTQKKLGMTTVINSSHQLCGIFTDGDLRRALDQAIDIHTTPIEKIMTRNPKVIQKNKLASEALAIMHQHKITALVITDDNQQPIGVVHLQNLLDAGVI